MTTKDLKQRIARDPRLRDLQIEWRDPKTLKANPHNPRTHSKAQIAKLVKSAKTFGLTVPVIVDGQGRLIAGHGRVEAWIKDGFELVPVIVISDMTEEQILAYITADNRIAQEAGWDHDQLRYVFNSLIEVGYEVENTGFDSVEIDTLLSFDDDADAADHDDSLAGDLLGQQDTRAPIAQISDHWIIGTHHLLVADARDPLSYEELMGDKRARAAFLDPPYNTAARNISGNGRVKHGAFVMGSAELTTPQFELEFLRPTFRNIVRYCLPGAVAFVCSDWRSLRPIWDAAEGVFVEPKNLVTWAKTNAGLGSFYRSQTEYVIPFLVSRGETVNNMKLAPGKRHRSTLWTYAGANTFRKGRMDDLTDHPTITPRKLVADAILDVTRPGDIILDCFLGSGTTLSAAEVTGRIGYGLELDPKYADVILRRLARLTGKIPHLADGMSIVDVAASRGTVWEG